MSVVMMAVMMEVDSCLVLQRVTGCEECVVLLSEQQVLNLQMEGL